MLTPSEIEKMWDTARFAGGGESPHKVFAAAVEAAATAPLLERIAALTAQVEQQRQESVTKDAWRRLAESQGELLKMSTQVEQAAKPVAWPTGSAQLHISLLDMGKAMAKERSREIGDAWNQLADLLSLLSKARSAPQPVAQPVHCQTCNDNGMIGGPSFYAPDEGGVPCPDCSQPDGMQPLEVLTSVWSAMQNSADGDDLLNKLEHMRDSIERAVQVAQQQALQELADDAQKVYDGYTAQPVQAKPSDVDFEAKTCPEAFLQQEISKLKTSLATTVDALEMGLQIGDQCSRGFLAKFHKMASDAITNSQPKPANQQKE